MDVSDSLCLVNLNCSSNDEVIRALAERLYAGRYVRDTFLEATLTRERKLPTGLLTKAGGVAIPHTDCEHVLRSAIAIALLRDPVDFQSMADPNEVISVRLVIMLAIAEPTSVVPTLARLVRVIQSPESLNLIMQQKDPSSMAAVLTSLVGALAVTEPIAKEPVATLREVD